ncbi:MAG: carbohydrate kinase [Spirochaetales bacterium]|nr:carbohydrate kinase [Spirochaetales bacterium]
MTAGIADEKGSGRACILALDQGTSATKGVIFDEWGTVLAEASASLRCQFPQEGFVEQRPEDILEATRKAARDCLGIFHREHPGKTIQGCGISNQRETFLLWDKDGHPLIPAIVWQCKRSIPVCEELKTEGLEPWLRQKTGLLLDPYFSATKLLWEYRHNPEVRRAVDRGEAFFGTVDTWLLYSLTEGKEYKTDHTNASRTMLFNIRDLSWDRDILKAFSLEKLRLPEVSSSAGCFGETTVFGLLPHPVPVLSMIGDSQAAAVGETLFHRGDLKVTLGTGSSILLNLGSHLPEPAPGMVTTVCFSLPGRVDYAMEGIIVSCGATMVWMKQQLGTDLDETGMTDHALSLDSNHGVYFIPAFSGLGAPHWKMDARGAIMGLTFGTGIREISRAALESIGFQLKDTLAAMESAGGVEIHSIRADGGIIGNPFVMQHLADLLQRPLTVIGLRSVSALGAAYLAGLAGGVFQDTSHLESLYTCDARYTPSSEPSTLRRIQSEYETWKNYINRLL